MDHDRYIHIPVFTMCLGNRAEISSNYINGQLRTLYENAKHCIEKHIINEKPSEILLEYATCLAKFYVSGKQESADNTFFASFGCPRVQFICNHEVILYIDIISGHYERNYRTNQPQKNSREDIQACTVAFRIQFSRQCVPQFSLAAIGNRDPYVVDIHIMDLRSNIEMLSCTSGAKGKSVPDGQREALVHYLTQFYLPSLMNAGYHSLFTLPNFSSLSDMPKIDYSVVSTVDLKTELVCDVRIEEIEGRLHGLYLEAVEYIRNNPSGPPSKTSFLAKMSFKSTFEGEEVDFDLRFGPTDIQALCKSEVILFVNILEVQMSSKMSRKKPKKHVKNWKIAYIIDVIEECKEGKTRYVYLNAESARICEHRSYYENLDIKNLDRLQRDITNGFVKGLEVAKYEIGQNLFSQLPPYSARDSVPGEEYEVPKDDHKTTEDELKKPQDEPVERVGEPVEPNDEDVKPEDGHVETKDEPVEAKDEAKEPEGEVKNPDDETVERVDEAKEPEGEVKKVEDEPIERVGEPVEPEDEDVEPEDELKEPEDERREAEDELRCDELILVRQRMLEETTTGNLELVAALTQASINTYFRKLWKSKHPDLDKSGTIINSGLRHFSFRSVEKGEEAVFETGISAPEIYLLCGDGSRRVALILNLVGGYMKLSETESDTVQFSKSRLVFEVDLEAVSTEMSFISNAATQLAISLPTAKFRTSDSELPVEISHHQESLVSYIRQYFFPVFESADAHVLYTMPQSMPPSYGSHRMFATLCFEIVPYFKHPEMTFSEGLSGSRHARNSIVIMGMSSTPKLPSSIHISPRDMYWPFSVGSDIPLATVYLSRKSFLDGVLLRGFERINHDTTIVPTFYGINDGKWMFDLMLWDQHRGKRGMDCNCKISTSSAPGENMRFEWRNNDVWIHTNADRYGDVVCTLACSTQNSFTIPLGNLTECDIQLSGTVNVFQEYEDKDEDNGDHWSSEIILTWDAELSFVSTATGVRVIIRPERIAPSFSPIAFDLDAPAHDVQAEALAQLKQAFPSVINISTLTKELKDILEGAWTGLQLNTYGLCVTHPVFNHHGDLMLDLIMPESRAGNGVPING